MVGAVYGPELYAGKTIFHLSADYTLGQYIIKKNCNIIVFYFDDYISCDKASSSSPCLS